MATKIDRRRLQRSLDLIEARLASSISLEELAAAACLSPFHFSRLFRRAIGKSPIRYVAERRVRSAQAMLASRTAPLAAIALEGGFGSQSNFTRVFRKLTGTTPGRYRELSAP